MIGHEEDKRVESDAYKAARKQIAQEKEVYVPTDYAHFIPHGFAKYCIEHRIAPDVAILEWEKSSEYRGYVEKQLLSQIRGHISAHPGKLQTYFAMFTTLLGYGALRDDKGGINNGKA